MAMTVLAKNKRQLILFYNSEKKLDRETKAHATSSGLKLLDIDISKTNVTGTEWAEIADLLGIKVTQLVDQDHKAFKDVFGEDHKDFDADDTIKILEHSPEAMAFPIVVKGDRAVKITQPIDIMKLSETDSAQIDKYDKKEDR